MTRQLTQTLVLFSFWGALFGCAPKNDSDSSFEVNKEIPQIDSTSSYTLNKFVEEKQPCDCVPFRYVEKNEPIRIDLWREKWQDSLAIWLEKGNDPLKVKALRLPGRDKIPIQLGIFENVELIEFRSLNKLQGITLFKKLREVRFEQCHLGIFPNELNDIPLLESVIFRKSRFTGKSDLSFLSKLKRLEISFSDMSDGPIDLSLLDCIQEISIGGTAPENPIYLEQVDLKKWNCLRELEISNTFGGANGFPKNLEVLEHKTLDRFSIGNMRNTWTSGEKKRYKEAKKKMRKL